MEKRVLIVGAGLGGLATGLRLAKKGYKVTLIEKNNQPGGRLNQIKKDGFTFDSGPSFFSMSYEFEEFARDCNIPMPFSYFPLDPLYSVNFSNHQKFYHLYKDSRKLGSQFTNTEPDFTQHFDRYMKRTGKLFDDTINLVIKRNFASVFDYFLTLMQVNPLHIPLLFRSFYAEVCRNFSSQEARQIISLVSFFLGRTPFNTMAIYTLLSYTEFRRDGYFNVEGGMYKIIEGITNELLKAGVEMVYNTEITGYHEQENLLTHLVDQNGKQWQSDIYVINSDAAWFRGKIFNRPKYNESKLKKLDWTMGYLTFYVGINAKLPHVNHHNYLLGNNYLTYAQKLLNQSAIDEKPYYYVNVVSKHNTSCAPEGCESLFFVCPVPNLLIKPNWSDKETLVNDIIEDFGKRIQLNLRAVVVSQTIYTPEDWQNKFNLYQGAGLGLSHTFDQIGAFRPSNTDEKFTNVFYVGANTIPGAGLPMAIISSKLVTERVLKAG